MSLRKTTCILACALTFAVFVGQLTAADRPGFLKSLRKPFQWRSQTPEEVAETTESGDDGSKTKVNTALVGDYVTITNRNMVLLQGVGLVVGLDGTGGDPAPSPNRTLMYEEMQRRNVKNPNSILRSPNTALVIVRGYLDPLVQKGDKFDIEVRIPPEANATSLDGGFLLETMLYEQALVPGQAPLKGFVAAKAQGPVLIAMDREDKVNSAGMLQRGRIVAGGISLKERDLTILLRSDFKSIRNADRIQNAIGQRFYDYDKYGIRQSLAHAVNDQQITLKLLPVYKDNYERYLRVIRNIAFGETEVARRVRMQRLEEMLKDPRNAEKVSLQLEAVGQEAVPILKNGLKHKALEVRFHSAMALAYMGVPDGLQHLADAAREAPAFRIHALAAMSVVDDAQGNIALRELMDERSVELRYGAFRALTVLDKNDPFVQPEKMNGEFNLHLVHCEGDPLVHLTNRKRAEVVLFDPNQKLVPPMALRAGHHILVTARPGSEEVSIVRFKPGEPDRRKTVSPNLAEIIRAVAEFEATFPDVAQMLTQASQQGNLQGKLALDALPEPGRTYFRPGEGEEAAEPADEEETIELASGTKEDSAKIDGGAKAGEPGKEIQQVGLSISQSEPSSEREASSSGEASVTRIGVDYDYAEHGEPKRFSFTRLFRRDE